jgi:hypothetical protein
MKVAHVKLKNGNNSTITVNYTTEVFSSHSIHVEFTNTHVVLHLYDGNIVAYKSENVLEVWTKIVDDDKEIT